VYDGVNVLAAPKAGFVADGEYSVFGAKLRVKRCFNDLTNCGVAVVTSECADKQLCRCRSALNRQSITFYYSRELGITSFFSSADLSNVGVTTEMQMDAVPLLTYVLVSGAGFLKAPFVLPKGTLQTYCGGAL